MLAFGGWILLSAVSGRGNGLDALRVLAGALVLASAAVLLTAIAGEWRTGEPFQHRFRTLIGISLFGTGTTVLALA